MENIEGRLSGSLVNRIDTLKENQQLPLIISYDIPFSQHQKGLLSSIIGYEGISHSFNCIQSVSCNMSNKQLLNLLKNDHVLYAEYDSSISCSINSARYWAGVDMTASDFQLTGLRSNPINNITGEGIVAAVIDTGIDCNHIDLSGKIIGWKNLTGNEQVPYDKNGHGTHSAGIIAGSGISNQLYKGIAPDAKLVGIKAIDDNGNGRLSSFIAAIDWIIESKDIYGINIVNVSIDTSEASDGQDAGCRAADKAVENGLVLCVAAGNGGPNKQTIGSPAAAKNVITVGAMADMGEKGIYLADFSGRGPIAGRLIKPDISAPGVNITGPRANSLLGYYRLSGTSSSAPFIAGIAALMLEANPYLTPQEIKEILTSTATPWGSNPPNIDYGYGLVNAYSAISKCSLDVKQSSANTEDCSSLTKSIPQQLNDKRLFNSYYNYKSSCGSYYTLWNPCEISERDYNTKLANYYICNSHLPDCSSCTSPIHLYGEGSILAEGEKDTWKFCVENTSYPIAITFIIKNWVSSSTNLDIYLYSPTGKLISISGSNTRQETIALQPYEKGIYTLVVLSISGGCSYGFDLSLAGRELYKE